MNRQTDQQQILIRISDLVTFRDNLQTLERELAGKANALGFAMRVPEHAQKYINIAEWVKASLNPLSTLVKSWSSLLKRLRGRKKTSQNMKKFLLSVEAILFWSKIAYDLVTTGTPLGMANITFSLALKAAQLYSISREEALKKAMDHFWNASIEVRRYCPVVIAELNREIDALK